MKPKFYAPILVFGMLLLAGCGSDKIQAPLPGGALDAADLRVLVEAAKQIEWDSYRIAVHQWELDKYLAEY